MPVTVQSVVDQLAAKTLSVGEGYFTFDLDYKPAINDGIKFLMTLINSAYGENKLTEEVFKEVSYTRCFMTSLYSRIMFDIGTLGHEVWTVLSVNPLPTYKGTLPSVLPNPYASQYCTAVTYLSSNYAAKRLTAEQWELNAKNPFMPGNTVMSSVPDLVEYGYLNYSNYTSLDYNQYTAFTKNPIIEIEVRPVLANLICGVRYAATPSDIVLITENIPFPQSMADLIVRASMRALAYGMGDSTTDYSISTQDLIMLFGKTS